MLRWTLILKHIRMGGTWDYIAGVNGQFTDLHDKIEVVEIVSTGLGGIVTALIAKTPR